MAMDTLAIAACELLESDKSTIRAACLRTDLVDALVDNHALHPRALDAFVQLANVKTGLSALTKHAAVFAQGVLSTDDKVAFLATKLVLRLPTASGVLQSTHVLQAFDLCLRGAIPTTMLELVLAKSVPDIIAASLSRLAEMPALTPEVANIFFALICRSFCSYRHEYCRHIARICQGAAVRLFIETNGGHVAGSLLSVLLPNLSITSFRADLFHRFAPQLGEDAGTKQQVATLLLLRYMRMNAECLAPLTSTERWCSFIKYLASALLHHTDVMHNVAPLFLLSVTVHDIPGHEHALPQLRNYLQRNPAAFNFAPTEDIASVERIIICADKLHVQCEQWRRQLERLRMRETQRRRLASVGVNDMSQPDAFCCPLTMEVMDDPVVASDGHTYERKALQRVFETSKISPLTRETLNTHIAIPNINLRKRIRDYAGDVYDAIVTSKTSKSDTTLPQDEAHKGEEATPGPVRTDTVG